MKQEESVIIKKSDIVLLGVILGVALIALACIMSTRKPGAKVQISIDGKVEKTFSIDEDYEYQVTTDKGNNMIVIKDGIVEVTAADCPDKVCANHVPIKNAGETIICLPHKLVVEIVE